MTLLRCRRETVFHRLEVDVSDANDKNGSGKEKDIHIKVVTTAKDLNQKFDRGDTLRTVFNQALALVGGEAQPDQFALEYNDEPLTALDRTLGEIADELGWGKKVELELVPSPVVV
jgi:hypothetical protein